MVECLQFSHDLRFVGQSVINDIVDRVEQGRCRLSIDTQGVVVRERGGTPFRQICWSWNGAPANIVGHRWNANTEAFRQITRTR